MGSIPSLVCSFIHSRDITEPLIWARQVLKTVVTGR